MVFITLGTQAKDFSRCLRMIDQLIDEGVISEPVFAQTGHTKFKSNKIICKDFVTEQEYQDHIAKSRVIISHAGTGALFSSIAQGKIVIAVARLAKYGEMVDDHQTEIVKKLSSEGYIIDGTYDLHGAWEKARSFVPRKGDFQCSLPSRIASILDEWKIEKK